MQGRTPSAQGTALHSTCRHPRLVCFTKRLGPASAGKLPPIMFICCGTAIGKVEMRSDISEQDDYGTDRLGASLWY